MDIKILRNNIDNIDKEIVKLLEKRFEVVKGVIEYKLSNNLPILDEAREKEVLKKNLDYITEDQYKIYIEQTLKAIAEAEAYKGPSLIIAYAPCINHGLRAGMGKSQLETKRAVEAGYWHLYRFNPLLKEEGKNPFILDSKEPTASFREFLEGEVRYASLKTSFPELAEELYAKAEKDAKDRYESYVRMAEMKY